MPPAMIISPPRYHHIRTFTFGFLFITLSIASHQAVEDANIKCMESERQALLSFKHGLVEKKGLLSSWENRNDSDCCRWRGVECNNLTNHVIKLDLHGGKSYEQSLSGKIGSSLEELPHLNYLDLSYNNFNRDPIPEHIGSLVNLKYLNLSSSVFSGSIPSSLGNLSNLLVLDISNNNQQNTSSLVWLSHLSKLLVLDLTSIDLSQVRDWARVVSNLPHLEVLRLPYCNLPQPIYPFSLDSNVPAPLQVLDLSDNCFTTSSSIFPWLFSFSANLLQLDLSHTCLQGYIPNGFGNMTSLTHVKFEVNYELKGVSPNSFENLCNIRSLSFIGSNLQGSFSNFLQTLPKCARVSLQYLRLSSNNLSGALPDFTLLPNLKGLDLSANELNGTVPSSLGQLVHLEFLDLAKNSLQGLILEAHFLKLTKLSNLVLGENSLVFDVQFDWVPPFQLDAILLKSCKLGPQFPNWLRTQNFSHLDISNASISGIVPHWFWENMPPRLQLLDLSQNNITGQIPTTSVHFTDQPTIFLNSNGFDGQVPPFISQAGLVDVSNNKFSAVIFLCGITTNSPIAFLDISNNQLSGSLPNCWENMSNLQALLLADNDISGNIPNSFGNLPRLQSLHLRNNCFSGDFPSWLKNAPSLIVLDLGSNNLSGPIPSWVGDHFQRLSFLSLRSNHFSGDLPLSVCSLKSVYFLDLSMNNITGRIPNCLGNLTTITSDSSFGRSMLFVPSIDYGVDMSHILDFPFRSVGQRFGGSYGNVDNMVAAWKGREVSIKGATLSSLKSIDLSGNHLTGKIPSEITDLIGLVSLNLSRNKLSGGIPEAIGRLKSLDFLDLSRNKLVGHIPISLSEINRLSVLDFSYNQLSGKIPTGAQLQSFNPSVYMGNLGLCGSPLPTCPGEETNSFPNNKNTGRNEADNGDEILTRGFYFSVAMGYIVGFWLICGVLVFHTTWRHAYFKFMSDVTNWVFIKIAIHSNKIQRLL